MATEYLSVCHGGLASFAWPNHCAACARRGTHTLTTVYNATSNAKFYGVYASWQEKPVEVRYPVCGMHWGIYYFPMKLTGMSLWHKVVIAAAAMAFAGGVLGFARVVLGMETFSEAPLRTYIALLTPLTTWWVAGHIVPVRVTYFDPPKLWVRIRHPEFASEFQRLNPVSTAGKQ